ncbi:PAS domain S-box protein [Limisalsivibrio acetivorans]|uniref:PAS domain S-box protein n=1 Tax=Limisalsivibrio acetivorans TaxID=1304888 RepID=UPI0003B3B06B|nr:PAS domain S-box protein [Limisalsivibrio acetivorans]
MNLNVKKLVLYSLVLFLLLAAADALTQGAYYEKQKSTQLADMQTELSSIRAKLETTVTSNLLLIHSMASYIRVNPDITGEEFSEYAEALTEKPNSLLNIAIAPSLVLTHVYPLEGNEAIIGVDYRNLPDQWPKVRLAAETGEMVIAGPVNLIQGGRGLVGRAPVFIEKGRAKEFWGIVSSVVDFDKMISGVDALAESFRIEYALVNPDAQPGSELIYGDGAIVDDPSAVDMSVNFPNGSWRMHARPEQGWVSMGNASLYIHITFLLIFALLFMILYQKLRKDYALSLSEKRFRDFTESSSDWVWEVNSAGQYTFASGNVSDILGYTPLEFIGKTPFDFMSEAEAERVGEIFSRIIKNQEPIVDLENWHISRSGRDICVLTNGVPVFDEKGSLAGYRGVDKDITERKLWEEMLKEEKEHTLQIIEGTTDAFFEVDEDFNIIYLNRRAELQLGVKASESMGKNLWELFPQARDSIFHREYKRAMQEQVVVDFEEYFEPFDTWYEVHAYPSNKRLSVYFNNITPRKKLQARLESAKNEMEIIFGTTRDGIAIMDLETNFLQCNPAYLQMTGYNYEEIMKTSCREMSIPEDIPRSEQAIRHVIEHGYIEKFEKTCVAKDGRRINVQMSISLMPDGRRLLAATRDITDLVRIQNDLRESKELLDLFFAQSLAGFFFMMLDEPVFWDDNADKEKLLNYIFENQRITKINEAMLQQYRAEEKDFIGLRPKDFFEHDIESGRDIWREFFDNGRMHIDTVEKRFDGTEMVVEGDYICLYDCDGRITGHFGVQRDVTKQREDEAKLERYINIVDEYVITSQTDLEGNITYASKAFCDISVYERDELIGQNHNIIRHPDMPDHVFEEMWDTIQKGKNWYGEIKNLKSDGGFYWVDTFISPLYNRSGDIYGYMAVRQDITAKKEIETISVTDRLTGIFNRVKLDDVIQSEHERFLRYKEPYSVILFDIDHFKRVNDTYGHLVGDYVLKELSDLAGDTVRKTDILGRWGGEEFMVVCPSTEEEGAATLAEHMRKAIEEHSFDEVGNITSSFGAACITDYDNHDALLKGVDDALYEAKRGGRNRVHTPKI